MESEKKNVMILILSKNTKCPINKNKGVKIRRNKKENIVRGYRIKNNKNFKKFCSIWRILGKISI